MRIDRKTEARARRSGTTDEAKHLKSLIEVSSKWFYWELDAHFRYTQVSGSVIEKSEIDPRVFYGKTPWDLDVTPVLDGGSWEAHKTQLAAHRPFSDFLCEFVNPHGDVRYINANGQPMFDAHGAFVGYRGISKDVTERFWIERRRTIDQHVATLLAESTRIFEATTGIIRHMCQTLGWSAGMHWESDAQSGFVCRETWHDESEHTAIALTQAQQQALHADETNVLARICTEGAPVWIGRSAVGAPFLNTSAAKLAQWRGMFALPIRVGSQPRGVLLFFAKRRHSPGEEIFKCATTLGTNLGQFFERKRSEEELRRFRAAIDLSADPIYLVDRTTMRFVDMNQTACRVMGYSREELLKMGPHDLLKDTDRSDVEKAYDEVIANGADKTIITERKVRTKDGRIGTAETHWRALRSDDRWIVVNISRDVTPRKIAEKAAQRTSRMYAALSATNEAILRAASPEELYQKVCDAAVHGGGFVTTAVVTPQPGSHWAQFAAMTGHGQKILRSIRLSFDAAAPEGQGIVGNAFRTARSCVTNDYLKEPSTAPWHSTAQKAGVVAAGAVPLVKEGRSIGVLLFLSEEKRAFDDEIVRLLERMAENIVFALDNFERDAERRRAEERIEYLATHDMLTGLPNRVLFNSLLNHAIQTAGRYGRRFAVLFIDLDRFKVINDTLGHDSGDSLLREMASRLNGCLRTSDVIARLGGDEFVLLVHEVAETGQVAGIADKLLGAITQPMSVLGQECRVTGSIGIAMYPADGDNEQSLMKNADIAMYQAKSEGKNNYKFYSDQLKTLSHERLALESALRHAIERKELSLQYQPKVDLKTGAITGVEALLRWSHEALGNVPPAQFIPIAEETGLIVSIGKWVLRTACAQNVAWQRQGLATVRTAVNLSMRQFADGSLLDDIRSALRESGLAPHLLELEITEGTVMQDTERTIKVLTEIKKLGVRLAIDDFGTGYSSLAQIKRFPLDTLKVDRSFIGDIPSDAEDKAITQAIIAMGKSLGLTIVAEGVETSAQADFLRAHDCDEMQGYHFSRPIDPNAFAELHRNHSAG